MTVRVPNVLPSTPGWADTFGVDQYGLFAGVTVNGVSQLLRWVEPGIFTMGSPPGELGRGDAEGPQHEVQIPQGFWLGNTPVNQEFYEAVTGTNPSHFQDDGKRPVERVSWHDATQFCTRLTEQLTPGDQLIARLPSEAEWEYACRAGTQAPLYNDRDLTSERGRCPHLDELGWYNKNSEGRTHAVGTKLPNAWGLYDMLGNVWEWCQDVWHRNYAGAPVDGSAWETEGSSRVYRGGCWAFVARDCRCACRGYWLPDDRYRFVGFRLVVSRSSAVDVVRSS